MRIMGGLLASAYLRTVFLWMPNSLAIARMERAPKVSLLHGLPPNPLSRRGCPAWRCRRLANSAAAVQCGAVGLDGVEGCQALLGVAAHAVDPALKAGAISERTIWRRGELQGGIFKKCVNSQAVYPLSEQHGLKARERRYTAHEEGKHWE